MPWWDYTIFGLTGVIVMVVFIVPQVIVLSYTRKLLLATRRESERTYQPPATIILCLRGADPYLKDCIHRLLEQDYDNFRLLCVLDHAADPAREVLQGFEASHPSKISVLVTETHRNDCSLKCNSLVQAMHHVDSSCEVIALVDGDATVDPHWLVDLVAPLADRQVVAASGNRWFMPEDRQTGTWVRYLWNLAAAPQMYLYQVTWGGSLAIRRQFVEDSGLTEIWAKSLFEDATVATVACQQKQKVVMIPDLLVPNRESISLADARRWITRQLLDTRLYHRCFFLVVFHAVATLLGLGLLLVGMLVLLFMPMPYWLIGCLMGFLLLSFGVMYVSCWYSLESAARQALVKRGVAVEERLSIWQFPLTAVIRTQWIYTVATCCALFSRVVHWRGIEYRIDGPFQIKMSEYRPMNDSEGERKDGESI